MSERKIGRSAFGLRAPIIRKGDNIIKIASETFLNSGLPIDNGDILGITESVVARSFGKYATIDEIAEDVRKKYVDESGTFGHLTLWYPIYSRNRFAICLRGIARAIDKGGFITIIASKTDEVGNKIINQVTGVNIIEYYREIGREEGIEVEFKCEDERYMDFSESKTYTGFDNHLVCPVRENDEIMEWISSRKGDKGFKMYSLADILGDKSEWGLYGSNKSSEEMIKLFPDSSLCQNVVNSVQNIIKEKAGKDIDVLVFGDGGFKDPDSGIWECLDPKVCIACTEGLKRMPSEVKIKNLADEKYKDLSGKELEDALKKEAKEAGDTAGKMISLGCTPRWIDTLVGSLFDLLVGSGSQGCPFGVLKSYDDNYATE